MVSKLKQRRLRRLKADVAWWREEVEDCHARLLELAGEIDRLKKLVIRVPMPVVVPESVADELKLREVG
ncbi:hypothetical protein M8370_11090 [Enterobacter cloacae complex sp. OE43NF]|uniref:hypothetical protein n=1 Tax=Enterobacter cloacae complex sp. OE43NF TaxID=2945081 RepID=UPI0020206D05|nr:hypothetical protein [Enterobacter cloacae complex sp. OE43NF]MCL7670040.1 hypothetical protein [Enterobacter cloacae complex sp. OE43NF]